MRQLKILTLITGLLVSSFGFGLEGGSVNKKREMTSVLVLWLDFHCPAAKELLARCVLARRAAPQAVTANTMHISVETWAGVVLVPSLDVDPNETINALKQRVATQRDITASQVRLFVGHGERELTDNTQTLEEAGVSDSATLVLVIKVYERMQREAMAQLYAMSRKERIRNFDGQIYVLEYLSPFQFYIL